MFERCMAHFILALNESPRRVDASYTKNSSNSVTSVALYISLAEFTLIEPR
jgi:hypothetical protein